MDLHRELFLRRARFGAVDYDQLYVDMDVPLPTPEEIELATQPGFRGAARRYVRMMSIIGPGGRRRYERGELVSLYLNAHAQAHAPQTHQRTWRDVHMELLSELSVQRRDGKIRDIDAIFTRLGLQLPTSDEIGKTQLRGRWHAFRRGFVEGLTMLGASGEEQRAWSRCVQIYALEKQLERGRLNGDAAAAQG